MTSRRTFLQQTATSGLAAAALAAFPPSIRRALAIPAFHETGTIQDVKHVVLLMMENRAFDSYFGTFKGVRGYGDRFAVPSPNGRNVFYQTYTKPTPAAIVTPYHLDASQGNAQRAGGTPHTWADAQAAWDHGRMNRWPDAKTPLSMGYYDAAEVPFQRALADAFTLCDHYHCGMHTGTIANRLFYWSGTNGPNGISPADGSRVKIAALNNQFNGGNDIGPSSRAGPGPPTRPAAAGRRELEGLPEPDRQLRLQRDDELPPLARGDRADAARARPAYVASTDITQPVTAAGAFYDPAIDDPLSPLAKGFGNTMPYGFLESFRDDIRNGKLPEVSWIIPPSVYSEHPGPSSPAQGGWYVQAVLDALTANPEVWSKTVLLVNYDENDGFFDHMPSPAVPSRNADGTLAGGHTLRDADVAVEYHDFTPATSSQPAIDGRPYGPGPRVPMWVVSPWSRGGWVNSQVFDHTSTLLFLEKRFGVAEPQIGAYRRAVCGDLTSAFNFRSPNNEPLPTLAGHTTKSQVDALSAAQQAAPKIVPPAAPLLPAQATGVRPSRALPYELHASARADAGNGTLTLKFANTGRAAAVFHVYDKLHLDRLPRRYVVEPGKTLHGDWAARADDGGKYDLWVLGPNGYHRRFTGDLSRLAGARAPHPEVRVGYAGASGNLHLRLRNHGGGTVRFTVKSNQVYGPLPGRGAHDGHGHDHGIEDGNGQGRGTGTTWTVTVRAGDQAELDWKLDSTGHWYDFIVTADSDPGFSRRVAGRVETGRHSVSDPAMGLADRF
ncbi:Non-hemolytic phospholipase C [Burkholderia cepacia]|nr:Non-hemolytic phospholipase C [Burkholderia cepacia]